MTIHEQMSQQQIAGLSIAYIKDGELQKAECFGLLEVGKLTESIPKPSSMPVQLVN